MRLIDADEMIKGLSKFITCKLGEIKAVDIKNFINKQPTVEPNQWIPCSERLPTEEEYCKNEGRFIVSNGIKSYECTFDVYEEIFKQFEYNRKGVWMEYAEDKVVAWMPLPQAYTGKESN